MQPSSKPTNPKIQSFLESLRKRSISSGPLNRAETNSHNPYSFENYQEKKRLEQRRKEEFFRTRSKEFTQVYSLTKKREEAKIEQLIQELRSLAKSMKQLKKEVEVAVEQRPIEVGEYQISFIDHLRQTLEVLRKDVESASSWLHVFNSRKSKKSYYWAMAQSKGTKFTLSEERGLATSIG